VECCAATLPESGELERLAAGGALRLPKPVQDVAAAPARRHWCSASNGRPGRSASRSYVSCTVSWRRRTPPAESSLRAAGSRGRPGRLRKASRWNSWTGLRCGVSSGRSRPVRTPNRVPLAPRGPRGGQSLSQSGPTPRVRLHARSAGRPWCYARPGEGRKPGPSSMAVPGFPRAAGSESSGRVRPEGQTMHPASTAACPIPVSGGAGRHSRCS
jgi:hypothetical protein